MAGDSGNRLKSMNTPKWYSIAYFEEIAGAPAYVRALRKAQDLFLIVYPEKGKARSAKNILFLLRLYTKYRCVIKYMSILKAENESIRTELILTKIDLNIKNDPSKSK